MIMGTGTDLVDIRRIAAVWARHGERFLARLLAPQESAILSGEPLSAPLLAKRWAAKEAFAKALGTGMRAPLRFDRIVVEHDVLGRPLMTVDAAIDHLLRQRGIDHVHVSLSDERDYALAFVILEGVAPLAVSSKPTRVPMG